MIHRCNLIVDVRTFRVCNKRVPPQYKEAHKRFHDRQVKKIVDSRDSLRVK